MDMKKTVVLGATPDSTRFAYKAAHMLTKHGHEMIPVGIKKEKSRERKYLMEIHS